MRRSSLSRGIRNGLLCALLGAVLTVGALLLFFGGFRNFAHAAKFGLVLRTIGWNFVGDYDLDEFTDEALLYAVDGLDDDWSYYMDAESYAEYQDYSANRYQGIGVTIRQDEETGGFLIQAITKDGPAHQAGLHVGDIIVAVDGVSVLGETSDELRSLIQADFGKQALVTVMGEGGVRREASVSCEEIFTNPVHYALLEGGVGYVAITNFRSGAGSEAVAAVEELLSQGADRLVFDVRNNPGGQVSEMTEILDYLLPGGTIFVRADKRGREATETSDESSVSVPMAVVVNSESYSAAEYFAAALHDFDWALTVGTHTTGKARSQVTLELPDGSALHISKYSYLTPNRTDLYATGGLAPDVPAELSEEKQTALLNGWLEIADDDQVQAAIESLAA